MAELIVKNGPNMGHKYTISQQVTLGRSCERHLNRRDFLLLNDVELSRQHLRISHDNHTYFIEDMNSTNGTLLMDSVLQPGVTYPIKDGDVLKVGSTLLEFKQGASGFHLPRTKNMDMKGGSNDSSSRVTTASVQVLDEDELQPDVSLVVDASNLIMELREQPKDTTLEDGELVKRMQAIIQVSMVLGAVTNLDELLAKIMDIVFDLFKEAERGFVITCHKGDSQYYPLIVRHRDATQEVKDEIDMSQTIIKEVLEKKNSLLLMDAQGDKRFGAQESVVDLAIRSVMCAPLLYENDVLGLVQIDTRRGPDAFSAEDLEILTAICAQIAISMKNSQLYQEIEDLFEGFVRASVQAIEARDPTTAGHSFRVAEYTENLASAVDKAQDKGLREIIFTRDQMQEIRYAALLHDFGKVGVREHVLTKAKKLYPHEVALLSQRFQYAQACLEKKTYRDLLALHEKNNVSAEDFAERKQLIEAELNQEIERLNHFLTTVLEVNEPEVEVFTSENRLNEISSYSFYGNHKEELSLLNEFEFSVLSKSHGSLNPEERKEIESHVSHTFDFLSLIPWTHQFAQVPEIAHAHHEKLDGTGYPQGLQSQQIPIQSKIMAIADVYDALTAGDRPYRQGINSDMALSMIEGEVRAGKLDKQLFRLFIDSQSYQSKDQ